MLEPFDLPGTVITHQGKDKNLITIKTSSLNEEASIFHFVQGLNGHQGTISLESYTDRGCYIYVVDGPSKDVKLSCLNDTLVSDFSEQTSFVMENGVSQYHPISFTAKGTNKEYVLQPLQSLKDEFYNVYFDIQP